MTAASHLTGDEKFPLLMVNTGSGDGGGHAANKIPSSIIPQWNTTTSYPPRRRSIFHRWPEYLSSCWMTLVLAGITFTVFYAIGMVAYKRDTFILLKCKNKTDYNVFLHHMVPRFSKSLSFDYYAESIDDLSTKYPSLHFNVMFLIDDSPNFNYGLGWKHPSRFLMPRITKNCAFMMSPWENSQVTAFEAKHPNVKISVELMSHFMGMSPLKHKWTMIPKSALPFYTRVISVWQNSGIGMDLAAYNTQRKLHIRDWRLETILNDYNARVPDQSTVELPKAMPLQQYSYGQDDNTQQEKERDYFNDVFGILRQFQQLLLSPSGLYSNANTTKTIINVTEAASDSNKNGAGVTYQPNLPNEHRIKRDPFEETPFSIGEHLIFDLIPDFFTGNRKMSLKSAGTNEKINSEPTVMVDKVNKKMNLKSAVNDDKKINVVPEMKSAVNDDKKINVVPDIPNANKIVFDPTVTIAKIIQSPISQPNKPTIPDAKKINAVIPAVTNSKEIASSLVTPAEKNIDVIPASNDHKHNVKPVVSLDDKKVSKPAVASNQKMFSDFSKKRLQHPKNNTDSSLNRTDVIENVVIMYDISMVLGPPLVFSKTSESRGTGVVTIEGSNGAFVSATTRYHPYLYQIIDAACKKAFPRNVIFEAFMAQCNNALRDDIYCNNIHIM